MLEVYLPYDPIRARHRLRPETPLPRPRGRPAGAVPRAGRASRWSPPVGCSSRPGATPTSPSTTSSPACPNRRRFLAAIAELTDAPAGSRGAVAVLDLDRFKDVNDSLGHDNGDELLVRLGERLSAAVRPGDIVARLGGDEFGVVLARVTSEDDALGALERLRAAVGEPVQVGGLPLAPRGEHRLRAAARRRRRPADVLLQRADIAMYVAKAGHAGVVRYDPAQDHYDADRLAVVGELRRRWPSDELVLHYQPKLRLSDGTVAAVEALVRWNHPRHGLLHPDSFLPLAEQTGLIDPLTDWVVDRGARADARLDGPGPDLAVAVNVSARNLSQRRLRRPHPRCDRRSAGPGAGPAAPGDHRDGAVHRRRAGDRSLHRLDGAGVPISLDDFGQGQTSLGYLSRLPLHELKVDKAFVTDLTRVETNAAIVRSLIELAHNLGFVVVAEGVEDARTLTALGEHGLRLRAGLPDGPSDARGRRPRLDGGAPCRRLRPLTRRPPLARTRCVSAFVPHRARRVGVALERRVRRGLELGGVLDGQRRDRGATSRPVDRPRAPGRPRRRRVRSIASPMQPNAGSSMRLDSVPTTTPVAVAYVRAHVAAARRRAAAAS